MKRGKNGFSGHPWRALLALALLAPPFAWAQTPDRPTPSGSPTTRTWTTLPPPAPTTGNAPRGDARIVQASARGYEGFASPPDDDVIDLSPTSGTMQASPTYAPPPTAAPSAMGAAPAAIYSPGATFAPAEPYFDPGLGSAVYPTCPPDGIFAGAEFLLIRPHLSDPTGYYRSTLGAAGESVFQPNTFNFRYNAGYRAYVGFQHPNCGPEWRFTFSHLGGDAHAETSARAGETLTLWAGVATVNTTDKVRVDYESSTLVFDLDYSQSLMFDGGLSWIKGIVGIRIADQAQDYTGRIDNSAGNLIGSVDGALDYVGAGPHLGLEWRRFVNPTGRWSLYGRGGGALLFGEQTTRIDRLPRAVPIAGLGPETALLVESFRVMPNFDVEIGLTFQPWQGMGFTFGWMGQTWFDAGLTPTTPTGVAGSPVTVSNGNLVSYDAIFLRAELNF